MEIVAQFSQVEEVTVDTPAPSWFSFDAGPVYQLLCCPACSGVILRKQHWNELLVGTDEIAFETLYPIKGRQPSGMPPSIAKAYEAAHQVRAIDANAFGVLIRRLLEMICLDRKATGGTLHAQLSDLSQKGEIPEKLVRVADGLRHLGNVGAHAQLGALTEAETPILDDLARAIVEYVYSAPWLADQAEQRLAQLRNRSGTDDATATGPDKQN